MQLRHLTRTLAGSIALAAVAPPLAALGATGDKLVDRILGQPNPFSNAANNGGVSASSLNLPHAVTFDAAGNLYVADTLNHRVLVYRTPMTTDTVADLVLGQPDFNSSTPNNGGVSATSFNGPAGVAVSAAGDVFVADIQNHRVLAFRRPLVEDAAADLVFGQPDFTSSTGNNGGRSERSLYYPVSVAVDAANNLWVADFNNHRVLEYDSPFATSDTVADMVLGQGDFSTGVDNYGGLSASSLVYPQCVTVDAARNVWVADTGNNRVLEFDDPKRFGRTADRQLGQADFMSNQANRGQAVDAAGLSSPIGVSVDRNGNVYVGDFGNHRVLVYTAPAVTLDRVADLVFGQSSFNTNQPNSTGLSGQSLNSPTNIAVDASGNVALADYGNHRVVILETPVPIVTALAVKVTPSTGRAKLVVRGLGFAADSAVVEVDGVPLATAKYKDLAADGTARRVVATDADFDGYVPPGTPVLVTVVNPLTGSRSAPIPFTR